MTMKVSILFRRGICASFGLGRIKIQGIKMNHIRDEIKTHVLANAQQTRQFTVSIEGNIASGKTYLLEYYSEKAENGLEVIKEPVDKWRNVNGQNLLGLLYENPERWSTLLQSYIQLTFAQIYTQPQVPEKPVRLLERSIFSARYCFVENLFKSGKMSEVEYSILNEWFIWLSSHCNTKIDLIVYLQTRPETVLQRIRERGRPEEMSIPLSYLESLHELHEDWLIRRTNSTFLLPAPVLVLDANQDLNSMISLYDQHHKEILHNFAC